MVKQEFICPAWTNVVLFHNMEILNYLLILQSYKRIKSCYKVIRIASSKSAQNLLFTGSFVVKSSHTESVGTWHYCHVWTLFAKCKGSLYYSLISVSLKVFRNSRDLLFRRVARCVY